ncbi:putative secreted protein [Ixodes scapularis]
MSLVFFAIAAFSIFRCGSATSNYPEMNPELGKYQDASAVFPLRETWYAAYRNYEDDPVFGTSKCLGFTEAQPEEDGGYPVMAHYGQESQSLNGVITLETSEGYNTKNLIVLQPEGQDQSLTLFVSYLDPGKCGVNRNLYVDETACTVFVPESQLGKNTTCCDFVYDLLCEDQSLTLFVSYLDPGKCGVNRNLYVDETACTVFVPESQLGKNTTCCDFVYDLLCGTTKHQIYDSSCDKQGK